MTKNRIYYFDNIKGILIICVVYGHIIENILSVKPLSYLYLLLYSFHMPLFIFCSGYFAVTKGNKIINRLVLPYMLFQYLYLLFNLYILKLDTTFSFVTPYWIMWYIFSLVIWNMLIILIKKVNLQMIMLSFLFALLFGLDTTVGYYAGLSRIIVFFPFFMLGFYTKQISFQFETLNRNIIKLCSAIMAILLAIIIYFNSDKIIGFWLYGSYPYKNGVNNYNLFIRLIIFSIAIIFSLFLLANIPNKRLPILSYLGKNSFSIYLIHGFIIRYVPLKFPYLILKTTADYIIYSLILLCVILVVLSSKPITFITRNIFRQEIIDKLLMKIKD